jgi:hypothetical protein
MHLGSAPRIPCPLRRLVPALFPAADAGCAILGCPCRREIRCTLSPVFIRHRFATSCYLLRSALFSDPCCSGTMCGCRQYLFRVWCFYTGVEALRQLVTMQPWPPSLLLPKHTHADYPLRRIAAPLWYPPPCLFCMFSCGQAAQLWHS